MYSLFIETCELDWSYAFKTNRKKRKCKNNSNIQVK